MQEIISYTVLKILEWLLRLAPLWIPILIVLSRSKKENTPHLTKTQIEYRRKMNALVRQGKVKNKYGQTETKLFDIPSKDNENNILIGIIKWLAIMIVLLVLFIIAPGNIKNKIIDKFIEIKQPMQTTTQKPENNSIVNEIKEKMPNNKNSQQGVANYLSDIAVVTEQNNNVTLLMEKYWIGGKITEYEINEIYQKLDAITVNINEAPEKGDVLKYNTINIIESNKKILNFIREDIAGGKMYYNSIEEESKKRTVFLSQQRDLIKGLLGAYEMPYTEDKDGRLHYTYKVN